MPTWSTPEGFWKRTKKVGDCIEWTGAKNGNGYGQVGYHYKHYTAHRLAFLLANGYLPNGLVIMHSCDNKLCVKPDHLVAGTHQQNIADAWTRNRRLIDGHVRQKTISAPRDLVKELQRVAKEEYRSTPRQIAVIVREWLEARRQRAAQPKQFTATPRAT